MNNGSEFYNSSIQSWLQDHDVYMYSTRNECLLLSKDLSEHLERNL